MPEQLSFLPSCCPVLHSRTQFRKEEKEAGGRASETSVTEIKAGNKFSRAAVGRDLGLCLSSPRVGDPRISPVRTDGRTNRVVARNLSDSRQYTSGKIHFGDATGD